LDIWGRRFWVCVLFLVMAWFASIRIATAQVSNTPSHELKDFYENLSPTEKNALEGLSEYEKWHMVRSLYMQTQEKKLLEGKAERLAQMDPLLKDAFEYFQDYTNKRREESVRRFLAFIEKNPESPFRAEIYYTIGMMYEGQLLNRKFRAEEPLDRQAALKYFALAADLYGARIQL